MGLQHGIDLYQSIGDSLPSTELQIKGFICKQEIYFKKDVLRVLLC